MTTRPTSRLCLNRLIVPIMGENSLDTVEVLRLALADLRNRMNARIYDETKAAPQSLMTFQS